MRFDELVFGHLLRREKRFLAHVRLDSGEEVVAHCANPGSMRSLLEPLPRVWLSRARPGRKLAYTWEVAEFPETRVYVNPVGANRLVAEALRRGKIAELKGYDLIHPEVKTQEGSRLDFLLTGSKGRAFVEVKSATMLASAGDVAFPDSVTERGTKHLLELERIAQEGDRAVLIFCVNRDDAQSVRAAHEIDSVYARTLERVMKHGVEAVAYTGKISTAGYSLERAVPIISRPS